MKKICFIITAEFTVKTFLIEHIRSLSKEFHITVVVNTNNPDFLNQIGVEANVIQLKIAREISPLSDLISLLKLTKILFVNRYDSVHTITPKAGLLGMVSAYLTFTKIRIHTFQGEVWITKKGFIRSLLKTLDKLVANLATNITVVSSSERDFLIAEKIISANKSIVFCNGSIAGVNTKRFKPDFEVRKEIRDSIKVTDKDTVILYLGRLNKDKGVLDLAKAFSALSAKNTSLLIVGPDEHNLAPAINNILYDKRHFLHFFDETHQPEMFMAAADVICLPSYREGFGVVIIEAAACGTPAIASRIYGITDAIDENVTGLMHEAGNVADLQKKLEQMAKDKKLRERLGKQAYHRAINDFNSELITQAWCDFYRDVIFKHD